LIIEGLPYFAFPEKTRKMIQKILTVPDSRLRLIGLIAMCVGLLFIYVSQAGE